MITILDAIPAMADVFSEAVPRPKVLRPEANLLAWARRSCAIRRLCEQWSVGLDTLRVGRDDSAPVGASFELQDALGDAGAVVHLAGRLVVLNSDGTRAAFYTAGEVTP